MAASPKTAKKRETLAPIMAYFPGDWVVSCDLCGHWPSQRQLCWRRNIWKSKYMIKKKTLILSSERKELLILERKLVCGSGQVSWSFNQWKFKAIKLLTWLSILRGRNFVLLIARSNINQVRLKRDFAKRSQIDYNITYKHGGLDVSIWSEERTGHERRRTSKV